MFDSCLADCKWKQKGKEITVKEGEAVGFIKKLKLIKICDKSGKLKYKKEKDVPRGYKIACNGK